MLNVEYTVQFLLFGPSLHAAKHQLLSNLFTSLTLLHLDAHMRFGVNVSRGVLSGSHCYQSQVFVLVPLEKRGGEYPSLHSNQNLTTYDGHNVLLRFLIVVTFPCKGDMHLCIFLHILMTLHPVSWISWCDICQQATKGNCLSFSEILIPFQHFSPITHRKGLHLCFIGLKCSFHC